MQILTKEIGLSNVYVIRGEKTIIIDTGCYRNKAGLAFDLMTMGVDPKEISLIIVTHGHMDHCGNLAALKELTGAPVLAHRNAVRFLETGEFAPYVKRGPLGEMFYQMVKDAPNDIGPSVTPDIVMGDEDFDLRPYGIDGKIIYAPGHVDSNLTVILSTGEAFCGDTIVFNPTNPALGTIALFCEDRDALDRTLDRLFKEAKIFYSGHGGPYTREQIVIDDR